MENPYNMPVAPQFAPHDGLYSGCGRIPVELSLFVLLVFDVATIIGADTKRWIALDTKFAGFFVDGAVGAANHIHEVNGWRCWIEPTEYRQLVLSPIKTFVHHFDCLRQIRFGSRGFVFGKLRCCHPVGW